MPISSYVLQNLYTSFIMNLAKYDVNIDKTTPAIQSVK